MPNFEKWIKTELPDISSESYDLTRMAWDIAYKQGVKDGIEVTLDQIDLAKRPSPSKMDN